MPIKLLSKKEIDQKQAQERLILIQEGTKLANRVDILRETAANEEASLASFRAKTVAAISAEIKALTEEKNLLLTEVRQLQQILDEGTSKLDQREQALQKRVEIIEQREEDIDVRLVQLTLSNKVVEETYQSILLLRNKFAKELKTAENLSEEAAAMRAQAQAVVTQSEQEAQAVAERSERVQKELEARDIAVASRERDVTIKEEHFTRKEKALHEREIRLLDRELTLEREFNRLKK